MKTIETTALQFRQLTEPVMHMASNDEVVPLLNAVKITTINGKLAAYATDRYRIGVQYSDIEAKLEALIPVSALKLIYRTYRGSQKFNASIRITEHKDKHGEKSLIISGETGNEYMPEITMTIREPSGTYPPILPLVRQAAERTVGASAALNLELLSGFRTAGHQVGRNAPATLQIPQEQTKPTVLRIGEDFIGIQMPVRMPVPDEKSSGTDWVKLLETAA